MQAGSLCDCCMRLDPGELSLSMDCIVQTEAMEMQQAPSETQAGEIPVCHLFAGHTYTQTHSHGTDTGSTKRCL